MKLIHKLNVILVSKHGKQHKNSWKEWKQRSLNESLKSYVRNNVYNCGKRISLIDEALNQRRKTKLANFQTTIKQD